MSEAAPAGETILTTEAAPAAAPAVASAPAPEASTLLTADPAAPAAAPAVAAELTDAQKAEAAEAAKTAEPKVGAPEVYEDFKLPDNFKANEAVLTEFKAVAKELGLTQEAAQKLVEFQTSQSVKSAQAVTTEMQAHVERTATEWAATAKADPEYGGEKFAENMGLASAALKAFGNPELKTLLNESRLGNHPELVRFMVKAGKAISQDGFVSGRAGTGTPKDAASTLYPSA